MGFMDEFNFWLNDDYFDQTTKDELLKIKDNESEIEERFYKELEFGTGGLRGVIGAGTNRMNIYTVRKGLRLHMIPAGCRRNLQMRQRFAWLQMELKRMYLSHCVQHQNFRLHCGHWAVFLVL